jgi:hypothetical protein
VELWVLNVRFKNQTNEWVAMNTQTTTKNWINTILIIFVLLNIIGDIGNIIVWLAVPEMRASLVGGVMNGVELNGGYLAAVAGDQAALIAGTVTLAVISILYVIALVGLLKRNKQATLGVIAISVANRALALALFEVNSAFAVWGIWTVILVVVAYLDYRKLSAANASAA